MNEKEDLLERVKKAKQYLEEKGIKRESFVDTVYGAMFDSEHNRVINLWQGKITDQDFTERLERFAELPIRCLKETADFQRFLLFVSWYLSLGGKTLSEDEIEKCYPKFKI